MSTFYLYWLDGKKDTIQGNSIKDAFRRAGIGNGAMKAIDFWTMEPEADEYKWCPVTKKWETMRFPKLCKTNKTEAERKDIAEMMEVDKSS